MVSRRPGPLQIREDWAALVRPIQVTIDEIRRRMGHCPFLKEGAKGVHCSVALLVAFTVLHYRPARARMFHVKLFLSNDGFFSGKDAGIRIKRPK